MTSKVTLFHCPSFLTSTSALHIALASSFMCLLPLPHLMHRYLLASAPHPFDVSSPLFFAPRRSTYLSASGLSSSHSYHCSCFRHKFCVQHCSCFFQLISLLIAFGDKPLKLRHVLLSSCGAPSHALLLPKCLLPRDNAVFPNFFHKSASPALGFIHLLSPFRNQSIIPLLSTWTLIGPTTPKGKRRRQF